MKRYPQVQGTHVKEKLPLVGCGGGGAPRDSAGSGATEEGLTSRGGRNMKVKSESEVAQSCLTLCARASSAKTRGFHTQLDEGPETP